jgi:SpoIID/LytB domain protein
VEEIKTKSFILFNLLFAIIFLTGICSKSNAGTAAQSDIRIRVGLVQHFGKQVNDEVTIESSSDEELVVRTFGMGRPIPAFKAKIIKIKPRSLPILGQSLPSKPKIIQGAYRTYESALYWADLMTNNFPDQRWKVIYRDPWLVLTESQYPEFMMKRMNDFGFNAAWMQDKKVSQLTLTTNSPNTVDSNFERIIVTSQGQEPIKVNGVPYKGDFDIIKDSFGTYTVINEVNLEEYLRGVVPYEVGANVAYEALVVQAILARTYALANLERFVSDGYNICASQHCQVYKGLSITNSSIDSAITSSRGRVLKDSVGRIAPIFYYSTDGGFSADYTDIWPVANPLIFKDLKGIPTCRGNNFPQSLSDEKALRAFLNDTKNYNCFDSSSPNFRWSKKIALNEITPLMLKAKQRWKYSWPYFTQVLDIQALERSRTGRVVKLLIKTDTTNFVIERDEMRAALGGLKSTLFIIQKTKDSYEIKGAGFGHGVGLSQYGARQLASQGKSAPEILKIYFPSYFLASLNEL